MPKTRILILLLYSINSFTLASDINEVILKIKQKNEQIKERLWETKFNAAKLAFISQAKFNTLKKNPSFKKLNKKRGSAKYKIQKMIDELKKIAQC